MADPRSLPAWADDLRRRYLRGESSCHLPASTVRRYSRPYFT
jgi:hypothetical protein